MDRFYNEIMQSNPFINSYISQLVKSLLENLTLYRINLPFRNIKFLK